VFPCLPHPNSNGWGMISWAITTSLLKSGHQVTVYSLETEDDPYNTPERQAELLGLGIKAVIVPVNGYGLPWKLRNGGLVRSVYSQFLRPEIDTFFPNIALVPQMKDLLKQAAPDAILAYHYDAIAATHGLKVAPRMALTADIWHWPSFYTWRTMRPELTRSYLIRTLRTLRDLYYVPKFMAKLLNSCEASSCFGAYDAAWLRQQGARKCQYLRNPIADACGSRWEGPHRSSLTRNKPKILTGLSNLKATATREAVRFFATDILPHLERELGPEGFEVHIVGEGEPPAELTKMLPRPSVILRGRLEAVDSELLSADILLVPTPIVLAVRTRIIGAFSFGCCVIAHTNEALNIPEMVHEENALLASDGRGLAEVIVRAIRAPELRKRLGVNARRTYERYFIPEIATAPIITELERIALEWKRRQSQLSVTRRIEN
jgi:glycosyltransferase involved in cell wall biosynthesis